MKKLLEELIADQVRPMLQKHHGDIELSSVDETLGVAEIKLVGSCKGCPGKKMTLEKHIIPFLKANVDGLKEVKLI